MNPFSIGSSQPVPQGHGGAPPVYVHFEIQTIVEQAVKKLATFPEACKISRAAYDPVDNSVHLLLHVGRPDWRIYHCIYDADTGDILALNGNILGPLATRQDFRKKDALVSRRPASLCLHDGRVYFLFRDREEGMCFGFRNDNNLEKRPVPEGMIEKLKGTPSLYTADGKTFRVYAVYDRKEKNANPSLVTLDGKTYHRSYYHGAKIYYRPTEPSVQNGGDVMVWTTSEKGKSWDSGTYLLERGEVGHTLQAVNVVMDYPGHGPFLITNEPTGSWSKGLTGRENDRAVFRHVHYDNPAREWKRLYALDKDGNIVAGD